MPEQRSHQDLQTSSLHAIVDRIQAGDMGAQDQLVRRIAARMELLSRKMLDQFSRLRRFEETDDVMTNACWRLLRSLAELRPSGTREFFALAAEQVRRELLDLAKRYDADRRAGAARMVSLDGGPDSTDSRQVADADEPFEELERWSAFHQAVPQLPDEEREVFILVFYHGYKKPDVAELLQCSDREVRRRWLRACGRLQERLGTELPSL